MARITWGENESGTYSSGLDRGVLFPGNESSVPWMGLVSVSERYEGSAPEVVYVDGRKVIHTPHAPEFAANLTAYTYPEEFDRFQGYDEIYNGIMAGEQVVDDVFHVSYRTMIDGGPHYQLHVLFNLTATADDLERMSHAEDVDPLEFSWDLQSIPQGFSDNLFLSHLMIDSRKISQGLLKTIEDRLYGTSSIDGNIGLFIETITKLADIKYNGEWYFVRQDDGVWTLLGPDDSVTYDNGTWTAKNLSRVSNNGTTFTINNLKEL